MGIAAAIIAGAVGTTSAIVGATGAAKSAEAQEEAAEKARKQQLEEDEKNRKLKVRALNLQGFDRLAAQRQQAQGLGRQRSFARDVNKALTNISSGGLPTSTMASAPQAAPPPMNLSRPGRAV